MFNHAAGVLLVGPPATITASIAAPNSLARVAGWAGTILVTGIAGNKLAFSQAYVAPNGFLTCQAGLGVSGELSVAGSQLTANINVLASDTFRLVGDDTGFVTGTLAVSGTLQLANHTVRAGTSISGSGTLAMQADLTLEGNVAVTTATILGPSTGIATVTAPNFFQSLTWNGGTVSVTGSSFNRLVLNDTVASGSLRIRNRVAVTVNVRQAPLSCLCFALMCACVAVCVLNCVARLFPRRYPHPVGPASGVQ
jgi:hypothetical protein